MTAWLRALVAALPLPHVTVVFGDYVAGDVVYAGADDEQCDHHGLDPDSAPDAERWVVHPGMVRAWLEDVRDGADIDELMLAIDMAEIGAAE